MYNLCVIVTTDKDGKETKVFGDRNNIADLVFKKGESVNVIGYKGIQLASKKSAGTKLKMTEA